MFAAAPHGAVLLYWNRRRVIHAPNLSPMRNARLALLLTGLLSLLVVGSLTLYVLSLPRPAAPPAEPGPDASATETGRLMPPEAPGIALYTDAAHDILVRHPAGIAAVTDRASFAALGHVTCDPERSLVCFPYDPPTYADTNFTASSFDVLLRDDLATQEACAAVQPGETVLGASTMEGVTYAAFSYADAATSHRLEGRSWRAFRAGNCYELSQRIMTSVFEVWEPGSIRRFAPADDAAVREALDNLLSGFRFQENLDRV